MFFRQLILKLDLRSSYYLDGRIRVTPVDLLQIIYDAVLEILNTRLNVIQDEVAHEKRTKTPSTTFSCHGMHEPEQTPK
jgi:hypothetical protein